MDATSFKVNKEAYYLVNLYNNYEFAKKFDYDREF